MNIVLNGNMNESSIKLEKGFYPNTELGIDLKLLTRKPGRLGIGEYLDGAITHDGEDHFTFYPTFNRPRFTEKFTFQDFCLLAAKELCAISRMG